MLHLDKFVGQPPWRWLTYIGDRGCHQRSLYVFFEPCLQLWKKNVCVLLKPWGIKVISLSNGKKTSHGSISPRLCMH